MLRLGVAALVSSAVLLLGDGFAFTIGAIPLLRRTFQMKSAAFVFRTGRLRWEPARAQIAATAWKAW